MTKKATRKGSALSANKATRKGSALSANKVLSPPKTVEVGQPGFNLKGSWVDNIKEEDLSPSRFMDTIEEMSQDSCISHPLEFTQDLITLGVAKGKYESTGSRKSTAIANFMNHCIHNMDNMTWLDAVEFFNTDVKFGFSTPEVVLKKETKGKYKGKYTLKKLAPRPQKSLHSWVWDENRTEITHIVQKPLKTTQYIKKPKDFAYLGSITDITPYTQGTLDFHHYPVIPKDNILHFTYNGSDGNPQGRSPLIPCYRPWKEKEVIQEYEIIGITRDFGGIPIARVPEELMIRANDPEGRYPEDEIQYLTYQQQLENIHAGRQSYFILSSDIIDGSTSVPEYDLKLLGIDGSGKQFDTTQIIEQRNTEIYNALGAGFLVLGQGDTTSSYNLSTTGKTVHAFKIERALMKKASILKFQLTRMLLDANGVDYEVADLPDYEYRDPDQLSMEEVSKFIQRAMSVGGLTQKGLEFIYKLAGIPTDGIEDIDFDSKGSSRAGESGGTSGTGTSQDGGVASSINSGNK